MPKTPKKKTITMMKDTPSDIAEGRKKAAARKSARYLSNLNDVLGDQAVKISYDTTAKSALKESSSKLEVFNRSGQKPLLSNYTPSTIYFGNQNSDYNTEAKQQSYEIRNSKSDYTERMAEVSSMKKSLLKKNFTLGEEAVEFVSDYQRGYSALPPGAYSRDKEFAEMKAVIAETGKCHFSLGKDKVEYMTNTQAALKQSGSMLKADSKQQADMVKAIKDRLTTTSITLSS